MKVPKHIIKLIKDIENKESVLRVYWRELYEYLDKHNIDCQDDIVADLQDGIGADHLIKYLEDM